MSISSPDQAGAAYEARLYRSVWRWHFYAGLIVIPFLIVLAATGLIMLYGSTVESALGPRHTVQSEPHVPLTAQAEAAVAAVPGGSLKMLVLSASETTANRFVVESGGRAHVVTVDPTTGTVLGAIVQDDTWYNWAKGIHGTLLIGTAGDRILEIVAGLGIVLVLTGLYLWWPRNGRALRRALMPDFTAGGRTTLKDLHASVGFYISIVLLFFLLSGLAWTDIWGGRIVQAWSTFPAERWNAPLSDETHAHMNHGPSKEVPWALEQTPMPASGSSAGVTGMPEGTPVTLDSVAAFARAIGFAEQFRVNVPRDATGVYTISADSMDGDTASATGDRTVHVDRYTGRILGEVGFADYSPGGKAMAVGIALHQGNLGILNIALNVLFCLAVLLLSATGALMWWKRRPAGQFGVPRYPRDFRVPLAILVIGALVCLAFPLTGLAVLAFAVVDFFLPKRWKEAGPAATAA